jgi:hypothetical protein
MRILSDMAITHFVKAQNTPTTPDCEDSKHFRILVGQSLYSPPQFKIHHLLYKNSPLPPAVKKWKAGVQSCPRRVFALSFHV